ncbi:MAG: DUF917 domain-containing protein, partial [Verrucomicrobiota bacterium]|nr:DUF917 domain-containing protein [Verrucomicrobiota bacterium]
MASRKLDEQQLEDLAVGAAILGTGGGGNPYIGKLRVRELMRQGKTVEIIPLESLADDDLVVSVGGIGAPVVGIEKIERGDECYQALKAIEEETGRQITALISAEVGGSNSMEPLITAAQAGIPVVDGDGMGRAFPEVQMMTFFIYGHAPQPAAIADEKGNVVVFRQVKDMYWLEKFARTIAVDMGAAAGFADPPMRGDFIKQYAIPGTLTQATDLGRCVRLANKQNRNPLEAIETEAGGRLQFLGKITDVRRELKGGFAVGRVKLESLDSPLDQAEIDIQNENLVLRCNGVVTVSVPDLIIVLDVDTG